MENPRGVVLGPNLKCNKLAMPTRKSVVEGRLPVEGIRATAVFCLAPMILKKKNVWISYQWLKMKRFGIKNISGSTLRRLRRLGVPFWIKVLLGEQNVCSAAHSAQLQSLPGTLLLGWQAPAEDWQENSSCGLRRWEQEDAGQNEERSPGLEVKTSLSPFAARGLNQEQPIQATPSSTIGLHSKTDNGLL